MGKEFSRPYLAARGCTGSRCLLHLVESRAKAIVCRARGISVFRFEHDSVDEMFGEAAKVVGSLEARRANLKIGHYISERLLRVVVAVVVADL